MRWSAYIAYFFFRIALAHKGFVVAINADISGIKISYFGLMMMIIIRLNVGLSVELGMNLALDT